MTDTAATIAAPLSDPLPDHARVTVVGAGFSGLALGMRLLQEGIDDFVMFI